jgi:hypothetical protein
VRLPRGNSSPGSKVQWDGVSESLNLLERAVEYKVSYARMYMYIVYGSALVIFKEKLDKL